MSLSLTFTWLVFFRSARALPQKNSNIYILWLLNKHFVIILYCYSFSSLSYYVIGARSLTRYNFFCNIFKQAQWTHGNRSHFFCYRFSFTLFVVVYFVFYLDRISKLDTSKNNQPNRKIKNNGTIQKCNIFFFVKKGTIYTRYEAIFLSGNDDFLKYIYKQENSISKQIKSKYEKSKFDNFF